MDEAKVQISRRRLLGLGGACAAATLLPPGLGVSGLGLSGIGVPSARAAEPVAKYFQIGTGTTGGTYFVIGGLLANAISNPPGSRPCDRGGSCGVPGLIGLAQATMGAVENIRLMQEKRLESGLIQADIAHAAATGTGPFEDTGPFAELRAIANLYLETIHIVVRADGPIRDMDDLRGQRVALGDKGSGTLVSARILLQAHRLSEKTVTPVYLSPAAAGDRLAGGEIDAFFIIGGYPLPSLADLAQRVPLRLLPLDGEGAKGLAKRLPLFRAAEIEAGAYEGVPTTRTLGVGAQWLVRSDVSEALVHDITASLWNPATLKMLEASHPRGKSIRLESALEGLAVPLHPGAQRFYKAQGMTQQQPSKASGAADKAPANSPAAQTPAPNPSTSNPSGPKPVTPKPMATAPGIKPPTVTPPKVATPTVTAPTVVKPVAPAGG